MKRPSLPNGGRFKLPSGIVLRVPKSLGDRIPPATWQRLNYKLSGGEPSAVDFGDLSSNHIRANRFAQASFSRELQARAYLEESAVSDAVWAFDLASDSAAKHAKGIRAMIPQAPSKAERSRLERSASKWELRAEQMKRLADTWVSHDPTKTSRNRPRSPGQPK